MAEKNPDSTVHMKTLSEVVNKATAEGYTSSYKVLGKGLTNDAQEKFYAPEEVRISNFFRFEGYSDPEDNSIVYLIETNDNQKGILIDAYGAYADAKISKFIKAVEEIEKKQKT